MFKLQVLFYALLLIIFAGCGSRHFRPMESEQPPANASGSSSSSYLLQHSGVLTIADKRVALRGILQLNPQAGQARVVMLNDLGMKLLAAEITVEKKGFKAKQLFASPFLRMIPPFYEESMRCIYEMYLAPENNPSGRQEIKTEGSKRIGNREFAARTIISDPGKNYTLELFLNSGSEKDS